MRVVLLWVVLLAGACVYAPLRVDELGNRPPVAAIVGGDALAVGAAARVRLDASPSTDPDGDPLAFAWQLTGDCATASSAPVATPWLFELATAHAGTSCTVTLTVTDSSGQSDAVTAAISVVEVGGFVANAAGCIDYDPATGFAGRGTAATPWCTLADGLRAASTFFFTDVRISADVQTLDQQLPIPAGLVVVGGFVFPGWLAATPEVTPMELTDLGAIILEAGASTELRRLAVFRTTPCEADCALVDATDASFALVDSVVGEDFFGGHRSEGLTASIASVRARSVTGPVEVRLERTTIGMPYRADHAYGLYLDGRDAPLGGRANGLVIHGAVDANLAAGVRLLSTSGITLDPLSIDMASVYGGADVVVAGLLDGSCPALPATVAGPCEAHACFGSRALALRDYDVDLQALFDASSASPPDSTNIGVALCGTEAPTLSDGGVADARIRARGRSQVIALLTVATRDLALTTSAALPAQLTATLDGDASTPVGHPLAVAWLDGLAELAAGTWAIASYDGGSRSPRFGVATLSATTTYPRTQPALLVGAWLVGTQGTDGLPALDGTRLEAGIIDAEFSVLRAAGLWTVGTTDLRFEAVRCEITSASNGLTACWLDGTPEAPTGGSERLVLHGADFSAKLAGDEAACALLVGTRESEVSANQLRCGIAAGVPPTTLALTELATSATDRLVVSGNRIGMRLPDFPNDTTDTWELTGLQDGWTGAGSVPRAGSRELRVENNLFFASGEILDTVIGVAVEHLSQPTAVSYQGQVVVENNVILGRARRYWTGVGVVQATVYVIHNTVRGSPCLSGSPCGAPLLNVALGVDRLSGGSEFPVYAANNVLDPGEATRAMAVVDGALGLDMEGLIVATGFEAFAQNAIFELIGEGCYLARTASSSGVECCADPLRLAGDLAAVGHTALLAVDDGSLFCGDRYHLYSATGTNPFVNAADSSYPTTIDIDGATRDTSPDIGADELGGCTP